MKWKVEELIEATGGRLLKGVGDEQSSGISTDSRTIRKGELFIPIEGNRFDGHDFIPQVIKRGAAGIVVRKGFPLTMDMPAQDAFFVIEVEDTLNALGDLACSLRTRCPVKVVAITGSNGKTSTKEMCSLVLQERYQVLKNEGNLNNLIGLPQSLLRLLPEDRVAVLEMGMNRPGEIRRLAEIARPDVGLITNIGPAHLEGLGSLRSVQRAKGELFDVLTGDDYALVNQDDPLVTELASHCPARRVSFGLAEGADVKADDISNHGDGVHFRLSFKGEDIRVTVPAYGLHHVYNALAASAAGIVLGIDLPAIARGIEGFRPLAGRSKILEIREGVRLIDETYNANPRSMEVALGNLAEMKGEGRAIAVLGDMRELGDDAPFWHRKVGRWVGQLGIDHLVLLGRFSPFVAEEAEAAGLGRERMFMGRNHEDVALHVEGILKRGDLLLIKGSRGMEMEKVLNFLVESRGRHAL